MGAAAATATAGGQGGVYQDRYGGYWEMDCGYYFSGSPYYDGAYQGTNGIGVFSCFNGCANRPGCVAFTYFGSSTGPTTGSGRCFHFFNGQQGNLSYNPSYQYPDAGNTLFGSAYLLQANENLLCPTYNGTYYLDAQGQTYYILCGYGSTSTYQNNAGRDGRDCLQQCDAQAQCIGVTVVYGGAETNANNNANCYLASAGLNTFANTRNVLAVRTTRPPFVPTTTTTTTSTSLTTSAAASSTCTFAVSPPDLPTNCGGRSSTASFLGVYSDTCGVTYSVYCRADSNPVQADQVSAGSISACMALCDNYVFADGSICQSAILYQGRCYLKRSFDGFRDANTDTTVMVRKSNENLLLANSSSSTASPTATVPYSTTLSAYTSYQPTNTWTINSGSCASGMGPAAATATAGGQGGVYTDIYNSYWEMDCDYAFSGADNYDGATTGSGTGSLGVYGCFNGCAQRPNCIGFSYYGTQSEPARGAGRCYFYGSGQQGDLVYSPTAGAPQATTTPIYGSAYLIQGSPVNMCPYWHNQYYVDSSNVTYYIMCGSDGTGNQTYDGSLQTSYTGTSYSWLTCLQSCSSSGISDCSGVTYKYTGLTTNPTIQCSYRRGRITPDGSPYGRVAIAIVTTLPSSSSRTSGASSSAPPQTVTYTYLSSYAVTYTTSYVTTAVSTAPGGKHSHLDICNHGSEHIRDHGSRQYRNINASSFYEYFNDDPTTIYGNIYGENHGNLNRANDGPRNPDIYNCIIIPSHHHHCEHSIWLDHNADYKLLCNIHGNQHDSCLFDGSSSYGDIYDCRPDGDTNYGILIRRHVHHVLSRHGYSNYIYSRYQEVHMKRLPALELTLDTLGSTVVSTYVSYATSTYVSYATLTTTQPTTIISTQVSSYGVTTTAPGSTEKTTVPTTIVSTQPASTITQTQPTTVVSTFLSTIPVTETYTTLSSYPYTYTLVSTASGSTITETSVAYRTTTQTSLQVSTAVSTAYSTIVSTQTVSGPTVVSTVTYTTSYVSTYLTSYPVTTTLVSTAQGSTVTTESISYATSTERTTIVSSYISTATETTTASGPTQTVSGPTQTQVITTFYVETYTTSYPVTETLPGFTVVTISYATTTVERTVVSSYISTERISVTQTQEVTTTQAASTLYGTTTQPGVTVYGTVTATI
ncbi:hypothetical protein KC331_g2433 [Hortaea werneckii]|nr:hypothetical protein KC331_g2433 [Hortaea werneckii]KAI7720260.1 hypothetical protein KC353_g2332 [Hortaea werneckii]